MVNSQALNDLVDRKNVTKIVFDIIMHKMTIQKQTKNSKIVVREDYDLHF